MLAFVRRGGGNAARYSDKTTCFLLLWHNYTRYKDWRTSHFGEIALLGSHHRLRLTLAAAATYSRACTHTLLWKV